MTKIAFVLNIESGVMESEAVINIKSIRNFLKNTQNTVYVINPYRSKIASETFNFFNETGVIYIEAKINLPFENRIMSKIWVAANVEQNFGSSFDLIIFVDNDTFFINPIEKDILNDDIHSLFVKQTDFTDDAIIDINNIPINWKYLLRRYHINLEGLEKINSARDHVSIYPVFNSGLIIEKPEIKLFSKWLQIAEEISSDKTFINIIRNNKTYEHYLDQTLLAIAIIKLGMKNVKILGEKYNYSLDNIVFGRVINFNTTKLDIINYSSMDEKIHIHYHKKYNERMSRYFSSKEQVAFLNENFPIKGYGSTILDKTRGLFGKLVFVFSFKLGRYK